MVIPPCLLPSPCTALAERWVAMYPGFTTVTATPLGPNSALRESKYPCRACLEAESRRERGEREKRERREGGERKKREERGRREGEEREKRGRREVLAVLAPNSCLMGDKLHA